MQLRRTEFAKPVAEVNVSNNIKEKKNRDVAQSFRKPEEGFEIVKTAIDNEWVYLSDDAYDDEGRGINVVDDDPIVTYNDTRSRNDLIKENHFLDKKKENLDNTRCVPCKRKVSSCHDNDPFRIFSMPEEEFEQKKEPKLEKKEDRHDIRKKMLNRLQKNYKLERLQYGVEKRDIFFVTEKTKDSKITCDIDDNSPEISTIGLSEVCIKISDKQELLEWKKAGIAYVHFFSKVEINNARQDGGLTSINTLIEELFSQAHQTEE